MWHNIHPHAMRWKLPTPHRRSDRRPFAEPCSAFVMDTEAPAALRIPCALEPLQCDPPELACRVPIKGDFLFHCHLEEHMMSGLAGLVRSKDWIWVTKEALAATDILLPYDDGRNEIGWVDLTRCGRKCPTGKHAEIATDNSSHDTHEHEIAGEASAHAIAVRPMSMPGMPEPLDICMAAQQGVWELLPCNSKVLAVHAVLMHSGRVLFFAGSGNNVRI